MRAIPNTHIVIYHKNCLDGFGAALAAKLGLEGDGVENIEFYPLDYSERENFLATVDLTDTHVHILDFSFNKIQTEFIIDTSASLVWLDHHESAFKEHGFDFSEPYEEYTDKAFIYLSPNADSGARLAAEYYLDEVPILISHIDDRDRWQFKLEGTKEICLALSQLPQDFTVWDSHLYDVEELRYKGKTIQEYYNEQLRRSIDATKREINIQGISGLCCNLPPMFASEAGNILAKESGTFGATWFETSNGNIKWSLRSIGDFNVATICERFGGGGHKNAAGFVLTPEEHQKLQTAGKDCTESKLKQEAKDRAGEL